MPARHDAATLTLMHDSDPHHDSPLLDPLRLAAVSGFLGVALGAFGAHGLESRATPEQLEWWRTAVLYQFFHVPALIALALVPEGSARTWSVRSFLAGTLVFSGTLYALALGGPRWLGAVTPLGGLSLMAGWIGLALSAGPGARASRRAGRTP